MSIPAGDAPDAAHMRRAIALAERGWGQTAPNPMVGAVVVRDGTIVGEGWHRRYGAPHAEPMALAAAGAQARGATLYVSLEPCTHHGKTPPCVDAIAAAGIARVVIATADPDPQAAGGAARLRAVGIEVHEGVEEEAARELNAPFLFAHAADRPWVTLKLATSIDGAITDHRRSSDPLTGDAARAYVHRMRAGSDAVAVGVGTLRADDALLTVRDAAPPRLPPVRVVFDDRLETPPGCAMLAPPLAAPVIVVATPAGAAAPAHAAPLEAAGAEVLVAASPIDALRALRRRGIRSLLVEGGAAVAGALLEAAVVDRLVIFQAPLVLGRGALGAFSRAPASLVASATRLPVVERRPFGDDLMTVYALTRI